MRKSKVQDFNVYLKKITVLVNRMNRVNEPGKVLHGGIVHFLVIPEWCRSKVLPK